MKLTDAACYFDRTLATDPVTGKVLFKCQVDPFDDSKRDAAASYRRILSVKPGTKMPAHGVAFLLGHVWLIGAVEPDGMLELHREKYVIEMAAGQLKVANLNNFLAGTVMATVYASPAWVKDSKQLETSSDVAQLYDIAIPGGTTVLTHDVMWSNTEAYLVLSPRPAASGLPAINALKLDQIAPAPATISSRTYNPASGTYGAPVQTTVNALQVRWQSLFKYGSQMSERYQESDVSIVLPFGTGVSTSTQITMGGVNYQVLAVLDVSGAVVVHARVT
jgi:hypothetical protein